MTDESPSIFNRSRWCRLGYKKITISKIITDWRVTKFSTIVYYNITDLEITTHPPPIFTWSIYTNYFKFVYLKFCYFLTNLGNRTNLIGSLIKFNNVILSFVQTLILWIIFLFLNVKILPLKRLTYHSIIIVMRHKFINHCIGYHCVQQYYNTNVVYQCPQLVSFEYMASRFDIKFHH